ncbi:hypothetical protein [Streptomyces sp. MS2.AVA.5]|uniref:Uncharacterized protein n=1 Tax=Streptomyces achmelvichensis TaxID=3134111 RepID=A0ACC6Q8L8_9ACTN
MTLQRPLGALQLRALTNLASLNSGTWHRGCVWQIGAPSQTEHILDSLVRRGLAMKSSASNRYRITEAGLNALGWYTCHECTRLTRLPFTGDFLQADRHVRCAECFRLSSCGLCERCSGECQDFRPGPRVNVQHLAVSPECRDVLAGEDLAGVRAAGPARACNLR